MKEVQFKIIKKNAWGHRFIEEPMERVLFRNKCKYQRLGCLCDKGYYTDYYDKAQRCGCRLFGCTANVYCPRLKRWDTLHGLKKPYTMVENNTNKSTL